MGVSENKLADSERLRLGRLVFDGADISELSVRYGLSTDAIDDAWLFCRRQLSRHFADTDEATYRLMSDEELKARSLDCLRLLLDWRESLLWQERLKGFGSGKGKEDDTDKVTAN